MREAIAEVYWNFRDTREDGHCVAYRLALSLSMLGVREVFHVSMLREYTPDPAHEVDWG